MIVELEISERAVDRSILATLHDSEIAENCERSAIHHHCAAGSLIVVRIYPLDWNGAQLA